MSARTVAESFMATRQDERAGQESGGVAEQREADVQLARHNQGEDDE
jgi:hypothetical protein